MSEIVISHVSKWYGTNKKGRFTVNDLSISIPKGCVFGFLGPNGAGKTTTMKMIVGLAQTTSGTITLAGGDPRDLSIKKTIGFMPESPTFYMYLTGEEFMCFIATIFGIKNPIQHIHQLLKQVELFEAKDKQIRTYSKGMLQRLGLIQALINNPNILFLDEPLDGLDPLGRAEIKHIITDLKKQNKTIFFNSHILADVEEICDLVGIIDHGKLITVGTPSELRNGYRDLEEAFVKIIEKERGVTIKK